MFTTISFSTLTGYLILCVVYQILLVQAVSVYGDGIEYVGIQNQTSGINTFWGIHYAQAPVGDLRWRAPVPLPNVTGSKLLINATKPGNACLQSGPFWSSPATFDVPQSEDCLLLNIQTPANPKSDKLPVFFYIHGGGYVAGDATSIIGNSLVHQANGSMIFVQMQYRLGPLGFLGGDDLRRDGTANAGLLDQRTALEWVRKNIHFFGGDPSRVTISGGSAGGGSATMQMILHGGDCDPPFRAAILEYPWITPLYDSSWVNKQYSDFLRAGNCSTLNCMRNLSASEIQLATAECDEYAYLASEYAYGDFYWGPTIDGDVIRDHPYNEFREKHFTKVPIIIDRDEDEGFVFTNSSITTETEAYQDFAKLWPDETGYYADIVLKLYPESIYNTSQLNELRIFQTPNATIHPVDYTSIFVRRSAAFGDAFVNCPTAYIAKSVSNAGIPVYKLIFNAGSQLHAATGPYIFSSDLESDGSMVVDGSNIPGNTTLAVIMRSYFISFTLSQTTNEFTSTHTASPTWPSYTSNEHNVLYVEESHISVVKDFDDTERCQFLQMGRGNNKGIWPQW